MDSLRGSFKSCNLSPDVGLPEEEHPILFDSRNSLGDDDNNRREVILKVDGNSHDHFSLRDGMGNANVVWRGSSYDFCSEGSGWNGGGEDGWEGFSFSPRPLQWCVMNEICEAPPRKLISFLQKQRGSEGDVLLDMYMKMEEFEKPPPPPPTTPLTSSSIANSKDVRVSFQEPNAAAALRRRSSDSDSSSDSDAGDRDPRGASHTSEGEGKVLKCSANSSFRRNPTLLPAKARSRLVDLPAPNSGCLSSSYNDRRSPLPATSPRSGQMLLGTSDGYCEDDDDDPFSDEDLPEKYRRVKVDTLTVFQWVSLLVILAALACSITIPVLQRQNLWNLHLWKWEFLVLSLICGRLVSGWVIRIVVFFFERNFLLRKRVLYFVYGLRNAVQNCLWLGLVVFAWHFIFSSKMERETKSKAPRYVTKFLVCLLVATLLWLVKTLLVKVLASSFHVSTYFDRIQEALFNQYAIETLSGPPLIDIQQVRPEEQAILELKKFRNAGAKLSPEIRTTVAPNKGGRTPRNSPLGRNRRSTSLAAGKNYFSRPQDEGITVENLHRLNQKNVSAWRMKRLMKIVRHGCLTTLDEKIPDATSREDESATQIRSEYEAKIAAKKIFMNVAKPGSKYIYLTDLLRFMPDDEAQQTISLFEGEQESKRVSKRSLKNWVVNAFRGRRALSLTLNDTKTAVNKLHKMVNVVVSVVVLVIWLLILGIATRHLLVFIGSQILLVVFIFGNTCKMIFEAIIFLFVIHPFDVGDRCEVDGVQVVVEEMNILTTVFLRSDNQKVMYLNSVLSMKPISNYYRSPDMWDEIDLHIHLATPVEKLAMLKERIKGYIDGRKEHWHPNSMVVLRDVVELDSLRVTIWLQHTMNYQDSEERWLRRDLVMHEMVRVLRELDIECKLLVPNYANVWNNMAPSMPFPHSWASCS